MTQMGPPAAAKRAAEEMLAYWASRREGGRLPGRRHIQPADFKRHLPSISLIDVRREPERAYRVRLAGTGLYGMYGGEITGKALEAVYPGPVGDYWRAELDKVVDQRRPAVGTHNLSWRGAAHITFMWLRLPLASDGAEVDMILGCDIPLGGSARELSGIRAA
ncbi:MAG: PAS domain-containing protein [Caulobacteraceae bacterium]|nr:PAS domain-containing protein [Caulobacter sp.]